MEKCIGCELCAGVCPARCIYVRGADNPPDAPGLARASATASSTRSTTCAASTATCASRPARPRPSPSRSCSSSRFTNRADAIYTKAELRGRRRRHAPAAAVGGLARRATTRTTSALDAGHRARPAPPTTRAGRVVGRARLRRARRPRAGQAAEADEPEPPSGVDAATATHGRPRSGRCRRRRGDERPLMPMPPPPTDRPTGRVRRRRRHRARRRRRRGHRPQPGALRPARWSRRCSASPCCSSTRGRLPGRRAGHRLRRRHRRPVPVRDHAARRRPGRGRRESSRSRGQRPLAVIVGSPSSGWRCWPCCSAPVRPLGDRRRSPVAGQLDGPGDQRREARPGRSSPPTCSPSRSRRCCSSSPWSAPWCWPAGPARPAEPSRRSRRPTPTADERGDGRRERRRRLVPRPVAAVLFTHRRRRPAGPPQRAGHVHVRRADAQRRQPHVRHLRPRCSTTSAARSSCSSCWWSPPPRSWSGLGIIVAIFRRRRGATADDISTPEGLSGSRARRSPGSSLRCPLAGFVLLLLVGGRRLGDPVAGWLATADGGRLVRRRRRRLRRPARPAAEQPPRSSRRSSPGSRSAASRSTSASCVDPLSITMVPVRHRRRRADPPVLDRLHARRPRASRSSSSTSTCSSSRC